MAERGAGGVGGRDQRSLVGSGRDEHGEGQPAPDDDLLDVQHVDPGPGERLEHRGGDPRPVRPGQGHQHGGRLGLARAGHRAASRLRSRRGVCRSDLVTEGYMIVPVHDHRGARAQSDLLWSSRKAIQSLTGPGRTGPAQPDREERGARLEQSRRALARRPRDARRPLDLAGVAALGSRTTRRARRSCARAARRRRSRARCRRAGRCSAGSCFSPPPPISTGMLPGRRRVELRPAGVDPRQGVGRARRAGCPAVPNS